MLFIQTNFNSDMLMFHDALTTMCSFVYLGILSSFDWSFEIRVVVSAFGESIVRIYGEKIIVSSLGSFGKLQDGIRTFFLLDLKLK